MMEGGGGVPSHGVIKPCRNGEKKYLPRAILEWTRGLSSTPLYIVYIGLWEPIALTNLCDLCIRPHGRRILEICGF